MRKIRALALAATGALCVAALPGIASAATAPRAATGQPGMHRTLPQQSAGVDAKATLVDPPVDTNVTATIGNVPVSFTAGDSPTALTVTYTNKGTTSYPISALYVDVIFNGATPVVGPTDFTISYQYPNGGVSSPAAGDCAQQQTDNSYSDVSCYLDAGTVDTILDPGTSVTVQVNLGFAAGVTADDAQIAVTPALFTSETDPNTEVDGPATESASFTVDAPASADDHAGTRN